MNDLELFDVARWALMPVPKAVNFVRYVRLLESRGQGPALGEVRSLALQCAQAPLRDNAGKIVATHPHDVTPCNSLSGVHQCIRFPRNGHAHRCACERRW